MEEIKAIIAKQIAAKQEEISKLEIQKQIALNRLVDCENKLTIVIKSVNCLKSELTALETAFPAASANYQNLSNQAPFKPDYQQ